MSPTVGDSISTRDSSYAFGNQYPNVQADISTMPQDGWLTYANLEAGGRNGPVRGRICIWRDGDGALLYASPAQNWQVGLAPHGASLPDIPMARGQGFFRGLWRPMRDFVVYGLNYKPRVEQYHNLTVYGPAPNGYVGYSTTYNYSLVGLTYYVPNRAPLRPEWGAVTPEGTIGEYNPEFSGTLPHPASEGGRDYSTVAQVQIQDLDTGRTYTLPQFDPRDYPSPGGEGWRRPLFRHTPGHRYRAHFRHKDSWGVWSPFTGWRHYQTTQGPDRPTIGENPSDPAGDTLTTLTGIRYHARYHHPEGVGLKDAQVLVYNASGDIVLYNSGWTTVVGPNASDTFGVDQFHEALSWGRGYSYRVRVRDVNNVISAFSALLRFRTNARPYAPTGLSPANGDATNASTLSFRVRDPDGDDMRAVVELRNADTGASVFGPSVVDSLVGNGGTVDFDAGQYLSLGTRYRWRARADDAASLNGPYSGWQEFAYSEVPTVDLVTPQPEGLLNQVREPGAEYEPTGFWSQNGSDETTYIERVADGDTPLPGRDYCWRAVYAGSQIQHNSVPMFVNPKTPGVMTIWAKLESGAAPPCYFRLDCLDDAGSFLGAVYGDSLPLPDGVLFNSTPRERWTRYGGLISPEQFPAGTTQGYLRVLINATAENDPGEGAVRFDAVLFDNSLPVDAAQPGQSSAFYGYFDGGTRGYREADDYYWTAVPGASSSRGLNILTESAGSTNVRIRYSGNSPKARDLLVIWRWTGKEYRELYRQWTDSNRLNIPLPSGVIRNEGRYRIAAAAEDVNGLRGYTGSVEFDVAYTGPPELLVNQVAGNDKEATISISWQPSELDPASFAGIEVSLIEDGEERILDLIQDQDADFYDYHFPRSGAEYEIRARQLELVGGEAVEGPWRGGPASASYREWFVKDIVDPANYNYRFPYYSDASEPSSTLVGSGTSFRPRHRKLPVHYRGAQKQETGSFEVKILDDSEGEENLRQLREVLDRRSVALLSTRPAAVYYVYLGDPKYSQQDKPWLANVSVEWEESLRVPDYYEREGQPRATD